MAKILTPVVTVFDQNEKPDYMANKLVIDFLVQGGVDGILVLGSTGEFTGLRKEEKEDFFRFYAEYAAARVELYAGTASMDFDDTVALSSAVLKMGYTAPLVVGPYYYGLDQEKIFIYYDQLAKAVEGSLFLYNYPARSGHSIDADTVGRLVAANSNITGLKDSVGEPDHTNMICRVTEGCNFAVYSGFDDQFLYNLASGGAGCIGGLSNIVPEIWSALVCAANDKNFERAQTLSRLIHRLMPIYAMDSNCSLLLKKLLAYRGVAIDSRAIFPFNQIDAAICRKAEKLVDGVLEDYSKLN